MAVRDQEHIASRRCALWTNRPVACIHSRKRMGQVFNWKSDPFPPATARAVCKAIHPTQISYHVGAMRCERQPVAGCGATDSCRTLVAFYKPRRVAAALERASRGHQLGGPKAAAHGVFAPLFAKAGAAPQCNAGHYRLGSNQWAERAVLGREICAGYVVCRELEIEVGCSDPSEDRGFCPEEGWNR